MLYPLHIKIPSHHPGPTGRKTTVVTPAQSTLPSGSLRPPPPPTERVPTAQSAASALSGTASEGKGNPPPNAFLHIYCGLFTVTVFIAVSFALFFSVLHFNKYEKMLLIPDGNVGVVAKSTGQ